MSNMKGQFKKEFIIFYMLIIIYQLLLGDLLNVFKSMSAMVIIVKIMKNLIRFIFL